MNDALKRLLEISAAAIRAKKGDQPPPLTVDIDRYPYAAQAGDNRLGDRCCPTCGRPPTTEGPPEYTFVAQGVHLFRDRLSAAEYRISGMCQACQDEEFDDIEEES